MMLSIGQLSAIVLALATSASSVASGTASSSATRTPDPSCVNSADDRSCWVDGFSIDADFDEKWPTTGKTNYYTLTVTNTTACPGGSCRQMMLINDQFPGPTISGSWGDEFEITVVNNMQYNGTAFHWHGIRQLNNSQYDGANGVSDCPIPPGSSAVYKWKATQYGTSWYHSHHSAQYADGVLGPIVIDGPATAPYDVDLGPLVLTDIYNASEGGAFALNWQAQHSTTGAPPTPANILVNGDMVNATGGGEYLKTTVTKGQRYRMRIINSAVDTFFYFSIDGHTFDVITSDFVPIQPIEKEWIVLALGQRYDIVFQADQDIDNYWIRTIPATACGSTNSFLTNHPDTVMGSILSYDGAADSNPTDDSPASPSGCDDQTGVTPWWETQVPSDDFIEELSGIDIQLNTALITGTSSSIVAWTVNSSTMDIDWEQPTLSYVIDGNTDYKSYPSSYNWYYWIIDNDPNVGLAHPIHLHGHDFFVLGTGTGTWDGDVSTLQFDNPMRRDVAILPAQGYLILAFPADNPGAWLMHCHIAWHVSDGLSLQFLERADEITSVIGDTSEMTSNCAAWKTWWDGDHPYDKEDSGL
ncbi:multicopper oxidase [Saccharata proteae CBS 121410]|uniref:laccase n=1 Tax=Saccharata proteae CBS 121410 TaxID=1314787 RepID=A0A9P4HPT7_9PEZI|nr:multicopper oxidase [Saccharata proteae CBS 121410]